MSKAIPIEYGESVTVDYWGQDKAIVFLGETDECVLSSAQAEKLAATVVGMTGAFDGKRNFKCSSGDMQELSPRRGPGGHVNMILTDTCGAGYLGEVVLTPGDALALAMELIRMAAHE